MIGRTFSPAQPWSQQSEGQAWIGKPWRRINLLTIRSYWKGEEVDRSRCLSLHLGSRKLGIAITVNFDKATVLDYSEEEQ